MHSQRSDTAYHSRQAKKELACEQGSFGAVPWGLSCRLPGRRVQQMTVASLTMQRRSYNPARLRIASNVCGSDPKVAH